MTTALHTPLRRIPFDQMEGFSSLFSTYCTDYERLAAFYAGDWRSPEARKQVAQAAATHPRDRDRLADVLLRQNERWGLDAATRAHIDALRDPDTIAVVTGQQVGLLTGPLYTPYKTLTTLQLARQLHAETGRTVVPVFWLEGSDHDFEEVAHVNLLGPGAVAPIEYSGHVLPEEGNLGPVGRLQLKDQIVEVIDQVEAVLPPTEFRDTLMAHLREAYRPGTTLLDAFAHVMRALFPETGLVFMDPDDADLKAMVAPFFRREIEDYATASARLEAVSEALAEDFHVQVRTRPTNLFLCDGVGRHPIDAEEDHFVLRGTERTFSRNQLLALLDSDPRCFSPNVVLRPLMQDWLLPTAAYVGGPGEVAYFAQYKPIYEWAGVPMPIIFPRASLTITEAKVRKVLDRHAVDIGDFGEDLDRLFQRVVLQVMDVDVDAMFKAAGAHLHQAINSLKPEIEQVEIDDDPRLTGILPMDAAPSVPVFRP